MSILPPKCWERKCKHYQGIIGDLEQNQRPACAAFPEGIPLEIAYGSNLHLEPVRGDHGILFEVYQPVPKPNEV